MEFREVLRARRSVKSYDPEHTMSDDEVKDLISHVALAPSSFNMQNWHFVCVRDGEQQEKLCAASWNQAQVKDAALTVVITGRLDAQDDSSRYLRHAPDEVKKSLGGMISGFYQGKDELVMQEACRSAGLAGMALMLTAKDMALDSSPMIGFDPVKVSEILGLPSHRPPLLMVTVGKALAPARPRMGLLSLEELVSLENYGNHALQGEVDES